MTVSVIKQQLFFSAFKKYHRKAYTLKEITKITDTKLQFFLIFIVGLPDFHFQSEELFFF